VRRNESLIVVTKPGT